MEVTSLNTTLSTPAISGREAKKPSKQEAETSLTTSDATQVEISDEAKALSKANPHQVAEALGTKNFGQAVRQLKQAGSDISVSDLVHGDPDALALANATLHPPVEELSTEIGEAEVPVSEPEQVTVDEPVLEVPLEETIEEAIEEVLVNDLTSEPTATQPETETLNIQWTSPLLSDTESTQQWEA